MNLMGLLLLLDLGDDVEFALKNDKTRIIKEGRKVHPHGPFTSCPVVFHGQYNKLALVSVFKSKNSPSNQDDMHPCTILYPDHGR